MRQKPKNFDKCFHHPHANYEYYCPEDNQSLCVYCKINGSHSQGKKASHHLIEISEAYERIIQESNKGDQFLIKKKDKLNDKLNELEKRIE